VFKLFGIFAEFLARFSLYRFQGSPARFSYGFPYASLHRIPNGKSFVKHFLELF